MYKCYGTIFTVDIPEKWEVLRSQVELGKELGQGSFGKVFAGILHDFVQGQPKLRCAVKTVFDDTPGEDRALFLREAELMTQLNCNHVVKLIGVVSKSQPVFVVMELMVNGDLKTFLRSRRPDAEENVNRNPPPTLRVS
jgi:insulin receptor